MLPSMFAVHVQLAHASDNSDKLEPSQDNATYLCVADSLHQLYATYSYLTNGL
jgi:hypothetical protein